MPWPLRLFVTVPLVVLAGRVLVSRDPQWKRVAAALFILVALLAQAVLVPLVQSREPWSAGYRTLELLQTLALFGAALVLFVWAFATRDSLWQRLVSFTAGLFGLGPVIIVLLGSAPAMFTSALGGIATPRSAA